MAPAARRVATSSTRAASRPAIVECRDSGGLEEPADVVRSEGRAEASVHEGRGPSSRELAPREGRRAGGAARVASARRNEDLAKRSLSPDAADGHAVLSDAAGEGQPPEARALGEGAGPGEEGLFEVELHAAGEVLVLLPDVALGLAWRQAEKLFEGRGPHAPAPDEIEMTHVEGGEPASVDASGLLKRRQEAGLSVRRKAHHLVLAVVDGEAEIGRHRRRREGRASRGRPRRG